MDLIFTNANKIDQGVLKAYSFDMAFGASENDFELVVDASESILEDNAVIYVENTEYGGMIDGKKSVSNSETITHYGRTWHGILNSKIIQPDTGKDYLIVSGDANEVLSFLIARLGLSDLFSAASDASGINISNYKFPRYCTGYNGIADMLASVKAKLKFLWEDCRVKMYAESVVDYTEDPEDSDTATLSVERYTNKVNHLICLGQGELAARTVVHLYADQFGNIGTTQSFRGLDEVVDVYENTNAESAEKLQEEGEKRLAELRKTDKADLSITETADRVYDIGDIVGATDHNSGVRAASTVIQKIVKISNGIITIEHKTGGATSTSSTGGGSGGTGGGGGSISQFIGVYIQPEEPTAAQAGALWYDTDEET